MKRVRMILPLVRIANWRDGLRRIDASKVDKPKQVAIKAVIKLDDEEHLHRENRIRPCTGFLLDDNGKVVGQAVRW